MKKLRLNKLFHWLYAILMLYPFVGFVFYVLVCAFNPSVDFSSNLADGFNYAFFNDNFNGFIGGLLIGNGTFESSSILGSVDSSIVDFVSFIGFDLTDYTIVDTIIGLLFVHWIEVSLFYLLFDVLMYPINLFHKWIDDGGF